MCSNLMKSTFQKLLVILSFSNCLTLLLNQIWTLWNLQGFHARCAQRNFLGLDFLKKKFSHSLKFSTHERKTETKRSWEVSQNFNSWMIDLNTNFAKLSSAKWLFLVYRISANSFRRNYSRAETIRGNTVTEILSF